LWIPQQSHLQLIQRYNFNPIFQKKKCDLMNSGGYLQLAQTICRRIKYFLATQLTQYSFSDSMTMTHQTDARPQEYDKDVIGTEITDGGARDSLFSLPTLPSHRVSTSTS
jgi:hypothetical protein